ncbi:hypothetical protein ACHAQH_009835 [Verticillium albo-atrum]
MKAAQILALMGLASVSVAQSLPPAPTESVGCEPHGDHWHCEGPAPTDAAAESAVATSAAPVTTTTTAAAVEEDHDHDHEHDHDHDHESHASESLHPSLPPSPTASTGCEPHGDHWHCEAAVETGAQVTTAAASASVHPDLPPQPTQSVGCEPHGDHWHCEGPAPAAGSNATTSAGGADDAEASSAPSDVPEAGAAGVAVGMGAVAVAALLAM